MRRTSTVLQTYTPGHEHSVQFDLDRRYVGAAGLDDIVDTSLKDKTATLIDIAAVTGAAETFLIRSLVPYAAGVFLRALVRELAPPSR